MSSYIIKFTTTEVRMLSIGVVVRGLDEHRDFFICTYVVHFFYILGVSIFVVIQELYKFFFIWL